MNIILFEEELINAGIIKLERNDERSIHIKKILRAKEGDSVEAGIINGDTGRALIKQIDDSGIILSFRPDTPPPGLHPLTLVLGLSRPPTVKKVLKEATALGVQRFLLCTTENGEKSYRDSNLLSPENIRKVLIEGARQACCTLLPELSFHYSLNQGLEALSPSEGAEPYAAVALDNYEAEMSLTAYWKNTPPGGGLQSTVLAVGSERGWTANERLLLKTKGFTLCSLGPRVLRTETASIAGAALCLSGMGLV